MPASDYWILYIVYAFQNASARIQPQHIPIFCLPTGEADFERSTADNLLIVKTLLKPSTEFIETAMENTSFDIIRLLNFWFITSYWAWLSEFGQFGPTTYTFAVQGNPNFS